jgi:hypothetical protein
MVITLTFKQQFYKLGPELHEQSNFFFMISKKTKKSKIAENCRARKRTEIHRLKQQHCHQ